MHPNLMTFDTKPKASKPLKKKDKAAETLPKSKRLFAGFLFAATRKTAG